jgi:hypothetical protein
MAIPMSCKTSLLPISHRECHIHECKDRKLPVVDREDKMRHCMCAIPVCPSDSDRYIRNTTSWVNCVLCLSFTISGSLKGTSIHQLSATDNETQTSDLVRLKEENRQTNRERHRDTERRTDRGRDRERKVERETKERRARETLWR